MSARELLDALVTIDRLTAEARDALEAARRRLEQLAANRADIHRRYERLVARDERSNGEG